MENDQRTADGSYIRRAIEGDAEELSRIAYASKAYWGYDDQYMISAKPFLTITSEHIHRNEVYVQERSDGIAGFYSLRLEGRESELVWLFVRPSFIGKGMGSLLWNHLVHLADSCGAQRMYIVSDPNAERFYLARGASRVGTKPSLVDPSIAMPWLRYDLRRS
ncbi:GNAT family N-acetyltransferase [Paenibacillus kobensis]|uniref:GNAT family N-acetyltransferase n=1 Tax=Paenibacillus kobensis TaxID=59841 RepID=UPI000FDA90B0|nr:GNAT family N-acetyltransferase [Paenibacillus kobensis]